MGYRGEIGKQNRARDLRAQGWTLSEICEEVGCSKSSASAWCRDVDIDEVELTRRRKARNLAGNEGAHRRGPNRLQRRKQAEIEEMQSAGAERLACLSERDLLVAGLALYAGEGAKTDGAVKFANSQASSRSPIERSPIRASAGTSTRWAARRSGTRARAPIERLWASWTRC